MIVNRNIRLPFVICHFFYYVFLHVLPDPFEQFLDQIVQSLSLIHICNISYTSYFLFYILIVVSYIWLIYFYGIMLPLT